MEALGSRESRLQFAQRRGSRSLKYDALQERFGCEGLLPLWVADMDCAAPDAVRRALDERVAHGVYGYSSRALNDACRAAVCSWLGQRHGVGGLVLEDCSIYAGVLEALAVCIEVLTDPQEGLILQTPAYNGFYPIVEASGRPLLQNPLRQNAEGRFEMDLGLLERQLAEAPYKARLFVLSSPHNPVGRVWTKAELLELVQFCVRHDLYLVSDEIHFDLVYSGFKHLSLLREEFTRLYQKIILISAPSKTFNIASLRSAYLLCRNPRIVQELNQFCHRFQIGDISLLGSLALEACYTDPEALAWLGELMAQLEANRDLLYGFIAEEFPELQQQLPEGSYLHWVDCRNFLPQESPQEHALELRRFFMAAGLALGWGDLYRGSGWVRINFACAPELLKKALELWRGAYQRIT